MKRPSLFSGHLRRDFLTGLAIGAPIVLTLWLVWSTIMMMDGWVMPLVPTRTLPEDALLRQVPGAGVLIFFVVTVCLGLLARGLLGRWLVGLSDRVFAQVPVVRSIYGSVKQITDTVLGQDAPKFDKACLVEYPRKGCWSVGFVSTPAKGEIAGTLGDTDEIAADEEILSLFVPTTPNPTSGFLLFVPRRDVRILDMGVDDAVKLVISAGLVYPNPTDPGGAPVPASSPLLGDTSAS